MDKFYNMTIKIQGKYMIQTKALSQENSVILTRGILLLITIAISATVANLYYNQPLLPSIGETFGVDKGILGFIPSASQIGYAAAILLISPLGDIINRKTLISYLSITLSFGLISLFLAPNFFILVIATFIVGLSANITQQLIPLVASMSLPEEKAKNLATAMTGLTIGILLSRTLSGSIAEYFGWKMVFLIAFFIAIIFGLLLKIYLPNNVPSAKMTYPKLILSMFTLIKEQPLVREAAITGALWFAAFNALWATLAIHVMGETFDYTVQQAGFFGFIGLAGIFGAKISGRLVNDWGANKLIMLALVCIVSGFTVMLIFGNSLVGLIIGIILVDFGVFGAQIPNQYRIFSIDRSAQSRINAVYMLFYYLGAALGSMIGVKIMSYGGWLGMSLFGISLSLISLTYHFSKNRGK